MEYKQLNMEDAHFLKDLARNFKGTRIDKYTAECFIENPDNYLIGCIDDNKVVGFALCYRLQRYDGRGDMMYVHEVEVKEAYRRKGTGKLLLDYIKLICVENDFSKMFVITNKSNTPAMYLYEKIGAVAMHNDDIVFVYNFD